MSRHPAQTMIGIWGLCLASYYVLPFQLLGRQLTTEGLGILVAFIAAFLFGTFMVPTRKAVSLIDRSPLIDAKRVEIWLMVASVLATIFFVLDASSKNVFDLAAAYEMRSETADALLKGETSNSSVWFQFAFLLYPASYVFSAFHILFARRVQVWRLVIFGLLPIILVSLVMGGRNPVFYGVVVAWLALRGRKKSGREGQPIGQKRSRTKWIARLVWFFVLVGLFQYFVAVFMARAAATGGPLEMFRHAEEIWGVGFSGALSGAIFALFGEDIAYLIFIFAWYLLQGFVMSNYLFSSYDGPMQIGIYGVDIMTALMRRLDPQRVAEGFDSLMNLGTYGFLPSAWGSLYVDFGFYSLIICVLWGAFAAFTYRRGVLQKRPEWQLVWPFVNVGIIFSIINTPLGYANGLITHGWVLVAFFLLKRGVTRTPWPKT